MFAASIPQVQSASRTENQSQSNIIQALKPLLQNYFAVTNLVKGIVIASGSNSVNHGLAQAPTGMIVTYNSANVNLYAQSYTSTQATFTASGACTADILFF